jgi:hypothetical protein
MTVKPSETYPSCHKKSDASGVVSLGQTRVSTPINAAWSGHLFIVDKTGKPWFQGDSATTSISSEPFSETIVESAVPPNVASVIKNMSRAPRKPPKMRAAARYSAPPIHPIFKEASDITDDPFWKDVMERMSKNLYRKGFRYTAYPPPTPGGRLVYRSKTREYILEIGENPTEVLSSVKAFMEKHVGMSSNADQILINRQIQEESKNPLDSLPKIWSDVKGHNSKSTLICHYAGLVRDQKNLTEKQFNDLIATISLGIAGGNLGDGSIRLHHGAIESVGGLMQDSATGEFYLDVMEARKAASDFASIITAIKASKKPLVEEDSCCSSKVTRTTAKPRSTLAPTQMLAITKGGSERSGEQMVLYTPSATQKTHEDEVGGKVTKTAPPAVIFSRAYEASETLLSEMRFSGFSSESDRKVSLSLPSPDRVRRFIDSYADRTATALIEPVISATYGFLQASSEGASESPEFRLNLAKERCIDFINKCHFNSVCGKSGDCQSLPLPIGLQKLIDSLYVTRFPKACLGTPSEILLTESSRVADASADARTARHEALIAETKGRLEKAIPEIFSTDSKQVKRAESLAYSFADKIFRNRRLLLEYQIEETQSLELASRPLVENVSSIGGGSANKAGASLKRWNKFVESLEKKLQRRYLENQVDNL